MKQKILVLLVLLILGGGVGYYFLHLRSPEYIIGCKVKELTEHVSKLEDAGNISDTYHNMAFYELFLPTVEINIKGLPYLRGKVSREETQSLLAKLKIQAISIEITTTYSKVNYVKSAPDTAWVEGMFRARVRLRNGEIFQDDFPIDLKLAKTQDGWKFQSCVTYEALKK